MRFFDKVPRRIVFTSARLLPAADTARPPVAKLIDPTCASLSACESSISPSTGPTANSTGSAAARAASVNWSSWSEKDVTSWLAAVFSAAIKRMFSVLFPAVSDDARR